MRRAPVFCFFVSVGFIGCSYTGRPAPMPIGNAMPAWQTEELVTVGADPYTEASRQIDIFGRDLKEAGVLPIQILVQNLGKGRLWIQRGEVALELPDTSRITPARATIASNKYKIHKPRTMEWADWAVAIIAFPIAATPPAQLAAAIAMPISNARAEQQTEDYWKKELKDTIVEKGASIQGFVYFIPPEENPSFSEATLTVPVIDLDKGSRFTFRLPLRFP